MNLRILNALLIIALGGLTLGCQGLEVSNTAGEPQNSESSENGADDSQSEDPNETPAPAVNGDGDDGDDGDTATGDAGAEAGGDSGEGSESHDGDWDDDWGDDEDPWDDEMGGGGEGGECFQACEMSLEENLYACNPEEEWEGDETEMSPPPPEEPQADPEEPEEGENEPTDPSDELGGDDECTEQAFEEFHGCIEQCNEDNGWGGCHPGSMECPQRCDYFAEDIMGMCMENVGNEEECAELSEHAHMICMDECNGGPGSGGPGDDCPDYSQPDCGEEQHVEWFEDEMGCTYPECVPNEQDDDDVMGIFECGEQACAMWEEYCQITYPGQPQGEIQHQCIPLPNDCDEDQGYCSCIESVTAGAGSCDEEAGIVYVAIYAP